MSTGLIALWIYLIGILLTFLLFGFVWAVSNDKERRDLEDRSDPLGIGSMVATAALLWPYIVISIMSNKKNKRR